MKTTKLLIRTNHSKYSIFIGSKLISNLSKIIEEQSIKFKKCLLVIDKNAPTSLFKRGLKFINIPTTLLAQVDSSIGGKTGVNTKHGKNLIGSFYQPQLVISDIDFLSTLPKREVICGYGEILKHSLISNKKLFKFLNKNFKNILACRKPYIVKAIFESFSLNFNDVDPLFVFNS